ncbi:MAG: tRNA pseudouridine(38-40) synthase TruA [Candidatus Coatesbacteria bacterium]|nr:tRNA pseudouridine(38-40) synthase TruA [Candidatus Coatesbacteria bacterium]
MTKYNFLVSYDGTCYSGFQYQPDCKTIQGELEKAFLEITEESIRVIPAGRTDAGVHARALPIQANLKKQMEPCDLKKALNALLPESIRIISSEFCTDDDFHPRFSAISRTYRYYMSLRDNIFEERFYWKLKRALNCNAIKEVLPEFLGVNDFSSYSVGKYDNPLCTVYSINFLNTLHDYMLEITANRFLHKMVRTIMGYLYQIGCGKRETRFYVAPACGLFLESVNYA